MKGNVRGLRKTSEDSFRELDILSPEARRLRSVCIMRSMIVLFKYMKDCHMEVSKDLFFALLKSKARFHVFRLQEGKFSWVSEKHS